MRINYILFALLSFVLFACRQEEEILKQEKLITLRFHCNDFIETAGTKADVNLPEGHTVRIVVFESAEGATSADLTRKYITTNTYEVQADGSLRPCSVDAQGNAQGGDAFDIQVPVFDENTKYLDFYAYSPAVPLDVDHQTVTITNNMDFMSTAIYGEAITESANTQTIPLPIMKHLCSAIKFEYIFNEDNVQLEIPVGQEYLTNRPYGVTINNLYLSGEYTLGKSAIDINPGSVGTYRSPDYILSNPTSPTLDKSKLGGTIYLLPGAAEREFQFKIDILFSNTNPVVSSQVQVTSYPACQASLLEQGVMTKFNMKVSYIGPGATSMYIRSAQIIPWEVSTDPIYFPL